MTKVALFWLHFYLNFSLVHFHLYVCPCLLYVLVYYLKCFILYMLEDQSLQSISEVSFCAVGNERFLLCNKFNNQKQKEVKRCKAGLYRVDNYQVAVIMAAYGPLVTITSDFSNISNKKPKTTKTLLTNK